MAKIKWGMIVADGRGKLGGQVFSKNRAGAYIRTKVTPTNPQTAAQTIVRQSFAVFSQGWSALSSNLIAAWNGAVSDWSMTDVFGDLKKPTGKNLYLKLNQSATLAGYASFTAVPAKLEMVEGIVTSAVFAISSGEVLLMGSSISANARIVVYGSPKVSAGTSYIKNRMRQIYEEVANAYSSSQAFTNYQAKFGTVALGENIFLGVKYVLPNGQQSPLQVIKATIAA